jgi:hypothetical protein
MGLALKKEMNFKLMKYILKSNYCYNKKNEDKKTVLCISRACDYISYWHHVVFVALFDRTI